MNSLLQALPRRADLDSPAEVPGMWAGLFKGGGSDHLLAVDGRFDPVDPVGALHPRACRPETYLATILRLRPWCRTTDTSRSSRPFRHFCGLSPRAPEPGMCRQRPDEHKSNVIHLSSPATVAYRANKYSVIRIACIALSPAIATASHCLSCASRSARSVEVPVSVISSGSCNLVPRAKSCSLDIPSHSSNPTSS